MNTEIVHPTDMEIVLLYPCPKCGKKVPAIAPLEPENIKCTYCDHRFVAAPADEQDLDFLRLITANGRILINNNFFKG
ncbi:MAG: hypothetical protein Q9M37_09430 [Desulfonauticus sp.]|nr:hypothetical protein [Desulfonauticus sp.]